MNDLYEAAGQIRDFCESRGWEYSIIGGVAISRWGEPRATQDVDLTIF